MAIRPKIGPPKQATEQTTELGELDVSFANQLADLQDLGDGRRSHHRYPADLGIRCRAISGDRVVFGKISDISTGGVRFTSSQTIAPGTTVGLSIEWPVLPEGACQLQLKGRGHVIRSDEHETAIEFKHFKFCTRKTRTAPLCGVTAAGA